MNRRNFILTGFGAAAVAAPAMLAASEAMRDVWRVRLELGASAYDSAVLDATTGENVSRRFPASQLSRMLRSRRTRLPIRVWLYLHDEKGSLIASGDRLARELRWIQVL